MREVPGCYPTLSCGRHTVPQEPASQLPGCRTDPGRSSRSPEKVGLCTSAARGRPGLGVCVCCGVHRRGLAAGFLRGGRGRVRLSPASAVLAERCQQSWGHRQGRGFLQTAASPEKQAELWATAAAFPGGQPFSAGTLLLGHFPQSEILPTASSQPCKLGAVGRPLMSSVPLTLDFKQADSNVALLWGFN